MCHGFGHCRVLDGADDIEVGLSGRHTGGVGRAAMVSCLGAVQRR